MKAAPEHSLIRGDIPDKHSHGNVFGNDLPSTRGDQSYRVHCGKAHGFCELLVVGLPPLKMAAELAAPWVQPQSSLPKARHHLLWKADSKQMLP